MTTYRERLYRAAMRKLEQQIRDGALGEVLNDLEVTALAEQQAQAEYDAYCEDLMDERRLGP